MKAEYKSEIINLLTRLKNNTGHFIIASDSFDIEHDNTPGDGFFCQFYKNSIDEPFCFEALSHYFDDKVKSNLKKPFFELGFSLQVDENYSKKIFLNSTTDITNVCNEVELIFETLYKVSPDHPYYFDDQIELLIAQNEKSNKTVQTQNSNDKTNESFKFPKITGWGWFFIALLIYSCYINFFDSNSSKKKHASEKVYNSEWDASVLQVTQYLKANLNDPDSYQSISWSEVIELSKTKEIGFASFAVRHKYRAKNSFGGYVVEEKYFKLDYEGNIVSVTDFAR